MQSWMQWPRMSTQAEVTCKDDCTIMCWTCTEEADWISSVHTLSQESNKFFFINLNKCTDTFCLLEGAAVVSYREMHCKEINNVHQELITHDLTWMASETQPEPSLWWQHRWWSISDLCSRLWVFGGSRKSERGREGTTMKDKTIPASCL